MCARLTTHGWPKGLLKIQMPIRIHLYRNYTKCRERVKLPRRARKLQTACRKRATPALFPVSTANTVLFAAVLFFASASGKFEQRRVRVIAFAFAVAVFAFAVIRMLMLPQ